MKDWSIVGLFIVVFLLLGYQAKIKEEKEAEKAATEAAQKDAALTQKVVDAPKANPAPKVKQDPRTAKAIGNIHFGCSESEFQNQRTAFLNEFPTLNGKEIDRIEGKFYKGKLYDITVYSKKYIKYVMSLSKEADETPWTDLYISKYRGFAKRDDLGRVMFRKNGIFYEINDEYQDHDDLDEVNKAYKLQLDHSKQRMACKINIWVESVVAEINSDKQKKKTQEKNKSIKLI